MNRSTVKVTVGEGVELAAGGPTPNPTAAAGGSFDVPLTVRNTGTKPRRSHLIRQAVASVQRTR